MGSNILDMYHQTPYRNIGHKVLRTSESITSESSCNQNSPEYTQTQKSHDSDDCENWYDDDMQRAWGQNGQVNLSQPSHNMSYDETVNVQNVTMEEGRPICLEQDLNITDESVDDHSLVEGADYDVIQVIAVDPNLLLEASSDEEDVNSVVVSEEEYYIPEDDFRIEDVKGKSSINKTPKLSSHDAEINYDTPVVSSVDEYFIKDNDVKNIFEAKDEPVVQDVDEYFIKRTVEIHPNTENTLQYNQGIDFRILESNIKIPVPAVNVQPETVKQETDNDLEDISNIEHIKQFLLNDLQSPKFKSAPKTQNSISLPQTPVHNICMDIDTKTCFSFEDLELSDLSFEHVKDKSIGSAKGYDIPRTLTDEDINSFLITNKNQHFNENADDLSHQDMEIEKPLDSIIKYSDPSKIHRIIIDRLSTSTPVPGPVIDFCIEKSAPIIHDSNYDIPKSSPIRLETDFCIVKPVPVRPKLNLAMDKSETVSDTAVDTLKLVRPQSVMGKHDPEQIKPDADLKCELSDFVDIESCNEGNTPILKANSLNSLLEQFEATEKFNTKSYIACDEKQVNFLNLATHNNVQVIGVQNKTDRNKLCHTETSARPNTTITQSLSQNSEHDYCPLKKRKNGSNSKRGRSLLKLDVLTSNNEILKSRHRSCKDKKIVYNLSSDDESDIKSKKKPDNRNIVKNDDIKLNKNKTKNSKLVKKSKSKIINKKAGTSSTSSKLVEKNSVMAEKANKASDICSQNNSSSIKLTIRNKSEVIINEVDVKSKTVKVNSNLSVDEVYKKSSSVNHKELKLNKIENINIVPMDSTLIRNSETENIQSNPEHFYTALFTNEKDVQVPQTIEKNKEVNKQKTKANDTLIEQQPLNKKKKLNLQEYKMRRGVNSNSNSTQVSPEAIFPETSTMQLEKSIIKVSPKTIPSSTPINKETTNEDPKALFDPIREASRKIILISKKQKLDALRKKEEKMLLKKIGKVDTLELQPLISDSEMMKIIGMTLDVLPVPIPSERVSPPKKFNEIVLVSIGTNTDENVFKSMARTPERKRKLNSTYDKKSNINFKIKKYDHLLKHNVFDYVRKDGCDEAYQNNLQVKIDKDRYKDIAATLKSVGKQVETKISSNSLFASIQDVVMKKAPSVSSSESKDTFTKNISSNSDLFKKQDEKQNSKITTIIREYDSNAVHGEDKIILHLKKDTVKPEMKSECCQTDHSEFLTGITTPNNGEKDTLKRSRHDSDMSVSSEDDAELVKNEIMNKNDSIKIAVVKPRIDPVKEVQTHEKLRPNERQTKYRHSRSRSHSRGRRRSYSRNRSRSRDRYHTYRRKASPYRRKQHSPYRTYMRSPSPRRDYRYKGVHSRSRHEGNKRSRTPVNKRQCSPKYSTDNRSNNNAKNSAPPQLASVRKSTLSESSYSSSRSSSVSKASASSSNSSKSSIMHRQNEGYRNKPYKNYSSEDRENNTPVEERRIVFVGKLEKDLTKVQLRAKFTKFGPVAEVRLHSKEDGSRYGFVTYQRPRDAWSAVEAAATFPQYDVGFGGRRAFCRQRYADLDGLEAKYTESAFHGGVAPARRDDSLSYEQLLLDVKNKLKNRKGGSEEGGRDAP